MTEQPVTPMLQHLVKSALAAIHEANVLNEAAKVKTIHARALLSQAEKLTADEEFPTPDQLHNLKVLREVIDGMDGSTLRKLQ